MKLQDDELGEIVIRKNASSSSVRFSLSPDGRLRVSAPMYVSDRKIMRLIETSRSELRKTFLEHRDLQVLKDGQKIGKHHTIVVIRSRVSRVEIVKNSIVVAGDYDHQEVGINQEIRDAIKTVLKEEAKVYLTKRLRILANTCGVSYEALRFSHASSRWGSCSSNGTISLNISLMKLPDQLIDYVLVHELSHRKHMDHSQSFWDEVKKHDPNYKKHRKALKMFSPFL